MTSALISVIIPCYNSERYLAESIESALGQVDVNVEVVAINDGSADNTLSILESFGDKIRHFSQENAGIGAARNAGIDLSSGDFLSFLDSDDLWPNDKLAKQAKAFEEDEELDYVSGHIRQFLSPDLSKADKAAVKCDETPMPCRLPSALLVRRESFFRVGHFDAVLKLGESVDWIARALEADLKWCMLDEIVLERRVHKANAGIEFREHRGDYARVIKAALERRRQQAKNN